MIRPANIEPVLHVRHDMKLGFAIKLTAETLVIIVIIGE